MADNPIPRVFISYSWTTPQHEERLISIATRLAGDGVDVIFDKWSIKEGHDLLAFMEQMKTDANLNKVLIFSDKTYAQKADNRTGGVGTETQIISKQVYDNVTQDKVIPIVLELDAGVPTLPIFLTNRAFINFSTPEKEAAEYPKLLRAIFNKPLHKKPEIGIPPAYILTDTAIVTRTHGRLSLFKDAILLDKSTYLGFAKDFLDAFKEGFKDMRLTSNSEQPFDEQLLASIESFNPYRVEMIEFLSLAAVHKSNLDIYEVIVDFFESSIAFKYPPKTNPSYHPNPIADNLVFILYELFLYYITILIKHKRFDAVIQAMEHQYLLPQDEWSNDAKFSTFSIFYGYCFSLYERNKRLKANRISPEADLLKSRATFYGCTFNQLMEADLLLFLRFVLDESRTNYWFPITLIYSSSYGSCILPLFIRAQSKKFFPQLCKLLGVQSIDDFSTRYKHAADDLRLTERLSFGGFGLPVSSQSNWEKWNTRP